MKKQITHSNDRDFNEKMKEILLYRKIVKAELIDDQTATLTLDNVVKITTVGNEGCGGCCGGWFYLNKLNDCDNAITNVECVCNEEGGNDDYVYQIFVFTTDDKIECVQYSGCDNGYYGTGFEVYVEVGDTDDR